MRRYGAGMRLSVSPITGGMRSARSGAPSATTPGLRLRFGCARRQPFLPGPDQPDQAGDLRLGGWSRPAHAGCSRRVGGDRFHPRLRRRLSWFATDRTGSPGKETGMEAELNVIGIPGGGLVDASWAANEEVAEIGRRGELLTAAVLDRLARPDGPTVLHDLLLPAASGVRVNVDHVVVSGRRVVLVDSKCWQPGRYWTALGRTRRGLKPRPARRQARRSCCRCGTWNAASWAAGRGWSVRCMWFGRPRSRLLIGCRFAGTGRLLGGR